jgi:hypothetical protein
MAVDILERPIGVKLGDCTSATIDEDYSGIASVNKTNHGLTDGMRVYITSVIENYCGFWVVQVGSAHHFFLKEYSTGPRVAYLGTTTITYCVQEFTHGWNAVHLPIVYRLKSTLWPTNSVDTARTVSSQSDDNGYTNLNLSGALKGAVVDLDYVKISGAASSEVNGVWQIKDAVSTSDITIDLVYDAGHSFSGGTVQYYYKNYHVKVKVIGGIDNTHPNYTVKPFEELAELKFIPDSDGFIRFSINEYLKSQIFTRNKTQLSTLPNNIDFWTQFYISVAEAYDQSDGTEVATYTSPYASDEEGVSDSPVTIDTLDLWTNNGSGSNFTSGVTPYVDLTDSETSANRYTDEPLTAGRDYIINYSFTRSNISSGAIQGTMSIRIKDSSDNTLLTKTVTLLIAGTTSGSWMFTAPSSASRISISARQIRVSGSPINRYEITSISLDILSESGFTGYAVNAKLPFKNQHSGSMSDYLIGDSSAKFLTLFTRPVLFVGCTQDISFLRQESEDAPGDVYVITKKYLSGSLITTQSQLTEYKGSGVYRNFLEASASYDEFRVSLASDEGGTAPLTEELIFDIDASCTNQSLNMVWLNYLGGFDSWNFTAQKEHQIEVEEVVGTTENILPSWPRSYGEFADTIDKDIVRTSRNRQVVRSQFLTLAQINGLKHIRTSPLVQIVNSIYDRRTVRVDGDSFKVYDEGDRLFSIEFSISYTDQIPSQTV